MKRFLIASLILFTALLRAQVLGPPGSPPAPDVKPPAVVAPADSQKLNAEQTANILKQLDQLDGVIIKNRDTTLNGALARCLKAESSQNDTLNLYLACYRIEHFDKLNLTTRDFTDWVKNNGDKLKDPEFLYGLWLQLEYLVIAIKAQDAENLAPLINSLQNFIQKEVLAVQNASANSPGGLLKDKPKGGTTKISNKSNTGQLVARLRENVRQSEFSKTLLLKNFLKREDWEYEPLALGSIYEKIIFPYYLEKKPADLPAQWDTRIKAELAMKQALSSEADYLIFFKEHQPEMIWKKSKYLLDHNIAPIPSLGTMLQIVRDNPTHANAPEWVKELRQAVNNAQQPSPPSPADTVGTPPIPPVN